MTTITAAQAAQTPPRVSFRDLCALFCCPPFPSAIVSKLAFMPPEPSYRILDVEPNGTSLQLIEGRVEWPHGANELHNVEVFYTRTQKRHFWSRKRNKIACMFVSPCGPAAHFTLLYSHANAVDLGQMCSFYYGLGYTLGCNVFSYDYSGYGCSSGRPSEQNMYADIRAALAALNSRYQIPAEKVILYGHSIGTVPSVDLASSDANIAALILHSPLMSGMRVAFPDTQRTWCCDAFPSIEKIPRVQCPTLVIHGTEDDVIDFSHGVSIFDKCPSSVEPLWVRGAGHNDIELHPAYLDRLRCFIDSEVLKKPTASSAKTPSDQPIVRANSDGATAVSKKRPSATTTVRSGGKKSSTAGKTASSSSAAGTSMESEAIFSAKKAPALTTDSDMAILAESGAGKIEGEKSTTLSWLKNKLT